jgi:hypothetical protein
MAGNRLWRDDTVHGGNQPLLGGPRRYQKGKMAGAQVEHAVIERAGDDQRPALGVIQPGGKSATRAQQADVVRASVGHRDRNGEAGAGRQRGPHAAAGQQRWRRQ